MGYGLGAVDWSVVIRTSISIEHQSQIVFGLTSVVFIVAMICTILSVKEQNPSVLEAYVKSTGLLLYLKRKQPLEKRDLKLIQTLKVQKSNL